VRALLSSARTLRLDRDFESFYGNVVVGIRRADEKAYGGYGR